MKAYETDRGEVLIPHSFRTPEGAIAEGWKLVEKGSREALAWEWQTVPMPPALAPVAARLRAARP